ncbi:UDP-N-acetylglucosamine 1-carboxyvinyltransferase [Pseudothermotoga sp.]|uniref:UDP-N-acetylglucosamine 1-carboxyvinyltransferase n=1 Tax=Pseudothermotoga sp. TaxID=2033661 RepID=UPI0031F721C3
MGKLIVHGESQLKGSVKISGAKNSALPILAATILLDEPVLLHNVPDLLDVRTMFEILESVGCEVRFEKNTASVSPKSQLKSEVPYEPVRKMRASFNVLGPLAVKCGEASVALPGGCSIGVRPVDFHLEGLQKLGFSVQIEHGVVRAKRERRQKECYVSFPFPSVGATEHIMTTAVLLEGTKTIVDNAAMEPEIVDLAEFLIKCGAKIFGAGTRRIEIEGVARLGSCEHNIIPDRIEAGTYAIAAAATEGEVVLENVQPDHMMAAIDALAQSGAELRIEGKNLLIRMKDRPRPLKLQVTPYPGFPTDLQPQMIAYLSTAVGTSIIVETVFKSRFQHVDELRRLGAKIEVTDGVAIVYGVEKLQGTMVKATDLRAAAALLIAGLMAKGTTVIEEVDQIFRGYEDLIEKLSGLSAVVEYQNG